MRTELFFPRETTEERRREVRAAFQSQTVEIANEGLSTLKSVDVFGVRIDAAFILELVVGGVLWDANKQALKRAIAALRTVWRQSGTVTIDRADRAQSVPPAIYFVPDGDEGDAALASIDADYERGASGHRMWLAGVGWVPLEDLGRLRDEER